jgi:alpha,alpha-trehalase
MTPWSLRYEGFDPKREGLRETLCALGNGYFVTRGAVAETGADDIHYPGTYLAGGYNRLGTEISGRMIENEDLVNMPNWLVLEFRIDDGKWFRPMGVEMLAYTQELDLRQGLLERRLRFRDEDGRETKVTTRRLVSMHDPHLAATETTIIAENWAGRIEFRSALDGTVVNAGVKRYASLNSKHLEPVECARVAVDTIYLKVRTSQSRLEIAQAARTRVFRQGELLEVDRETTDQPGLVAQTFAVELRQGDAVTIEKVVALFSGRDRAISECGLEARDAVARAQGFEALLAQHADAWEQLWQRFEIEVEQGDGNGETRMILHLHIFHLLQTTSTHSTECDVGVPARGWHGEAYRGHIFWDELFIFPLLNFHIPELTRALLMYRHRRLGQARLAARAAGYRGALFPWQSGSNGREESQIVHLNPRSGRWVPDETYIQRHVNAAIAYNIWQYSEVARDSEFLHFAGAEMFLEIAKFWASLATFNETLDRFEILGVVGPDEYHTRIPGRDAPGLDNNSYTNALAAWILWQALELLDFLPRDRSHELTAKLGIDGAELERWQAISRRMRIVFHDDGVISQFEGYDALKEFDWDGYAAKYGDIHRLDRILEAEGDSVNCYKASKQADVLMLFYLFSAEMLGELFGRLGYAFDADTIPRNIDYYLSRTSHGSTLSNVIHSWVSARLDRERSWRHFTAALRSDLEDVQGGTTPEGIHLGAMAGTVDLIERGYTGMELRRDTLHFNPALPEHVRKLRIRVRYRGHSLAVDVSSDALAVHSTKSDKGPVRISCGGEVRELLPGDTARFRIGSGSGKPAPRESKAAASR